MQTYRGLLALVTLALEGLATPARVEGCTLAQAVALTRVLVAVPTLARAVALIRVLVAVPTLARAVALTWVLVAVPTLAQAVALTLAPAVAHTAGLEGLAPLDRADAIPIRGIDRRLTVNDFEAR
jgi:hypothetical protein